MKIFFRTIHLYLSLIAGLIIMTTCFTGAVLVFEKELQENFYRERYFVEPMGQKLPLEKLIASVKKEAPKAKISSVKLYSDPTRSVEIGYSVKEKEDKKHESKAHGSASDKSKKSNAEAKVDGGNRKIAFVNPYTGAVIELYTYRETFFYKMFALHRWLFGSNDGIGKYIVGICTFIFLFILVTGIVLWWPKTRNILSQRLKIKWDGGWKRLNHDFHIVLGFYAAIFLFIFAFTGLSWSFKWFNKGIYLMTNSEMKPVETPTSIYIPNKKPILSDAVLATVQSKVPDVEFYNIMAPKDSTGVFTVNVLPVDKKEMATDSYYIDQYSNQLIGTLKFSDKNLGQRIRSTFKPIHVASIFGIPSKVIGLIVCILGATFPITGIVLWINRIYKKPKKRKEELATANG